MTKIKTFKTSDINLASCLKLKNYNLTSIEVVGSKGTFIFENVDQDFVNEYNLGKVLVEPVTFNNTIKQLTTSVRRIAAKTE